MITLTLVLVPVGLPVEGIGLIIGVDRLLDMLRTAVNVTGDGAVATIVASPKTSLIRKFSEIRSRTLEVGLCKNGREFGKPNLKQNSDFVSVLMRSREHFSGFLDSLGYQIKVVV